MTGYDRRGHITVPTTRGTWAAISDCDRSGDFPLSAEADLVLAAGLSFPQFGAPPQAALKVVIADRVKRSGSKFRPPGRDKIQAGLTELRTKGFYAVRKESGGRKPGNKKPQWATLLSFGNEPWKHIADLKALSKDEVWWHFRRMRAATAHLTAVDETAPPRLSVAS